jgi:hypothetical protein
MTLKKIATATCLSLGALSFGGTHAAVVECPPTLDSLVTGTVDCQYSTTHDQDFLNTDPLTVNLEGGFFGFTDWMFSTKLTENGGQSGTWNIGSFIDNWSSAMLVFKSGSGTNLVGYLVDDGVTAGAWSSPFRNPPFSALNAGQIRDVSHISLYFRQAIGETPGNGQKVSEPATLGLLGLGLLGLVALRRRPA